MESENHDNEAAGGGGGHEIKSVILSVTNDKDLAVEELQETAAKKKCDPGEAQHSENNDERTGGESVITSVLSATNEEVIPELTLVLVGDTNSIEIGPKNIIFDHDEQTNVDPFSSKLYDLCGRHISVINMQGFQSTDQFPLNRGVHAFLLLLTNGLHHSQYSSGVQWLEKAFGKESLAYLMTVVTHKSDEKCESALTDLNAFKGFTEKRYHTCTKSMMDEREVLALLEKIDVMVSENDPHCYSGLIFDDNKEQRDLLDYKSNKAERINSSVSQQNQTVEELEENAAECDPVNKPDVAEHSEKNDDNTTVGGESESKSVKPSETNEKDPSTTSTPGTEQEADNAGFDHSTGEVDDLKEVHDESSRNISEPTAGKSESVTREIKELTPELTLVLVGDTKSTEIGSKNISLDSMMDENEVTSLMKKIDVMVSENHPHCHSGLVCDDNKEQKDLLDHKSQEEERIDSSVSQLNQTDALEKNAAEKLIKRDPVNKPGDVEHSDKNDDSTRSGRDPDTQSLKASVPHEKGTSFTDVDRNKDENSENINMEEQYQSLLKRLHLQKKLRPPDFLRTPSKQHYDASEKDLAHTFLQRLMMLDYRARYIPVKQDSPEASLSKPMNKEADDDDFDALFKSRRDSDETKQSHVHPMDVQMAVFHRSDSFLKQNMITKLSQCQYALPLLVPDPVKMDIEYPLWTFRQIRKTWNITQTKDDSNIVTMKSMPIYKAETPMVSFLRLGSPSLSKSQLMNTLINDRHSTFFHRNCPGSTKSRHLMDGVAEIAWYCPAGKPNDAFTDCIAFCNLHGDALMIEKQREILIEKSSVNVILLPTLEKSDKSWTFISGLLKSPKPLICLIVDKDCDAAEIKEGKYKLGLKDRSWSDVSEELKGIIGKILSGPHKSFQLETMAEVSGIRVDEDDTDCQKGKSTAMKLMNLLKDMDVSKIKDEYLPCQGKLWHDWCKINKEQYHLRGNLQMEKDKKQQELEKIRQEQCDTPCSKLIRFFTESLSSLPSKKKVYFLKWIQILLDALSTDDLSSILQNYDEKWTEVLDLKKKHDKSDQLISKQTELEEISAKLQSATFGLEHIFREIGQIYEAHKSVQEQTMMEETDWSKYPELAAELMISGHPMELMDGDAGHVPLTWISSLLDEVIKKLGDQRVFVLSVLGVQSSGKSTMLNAMFGLQFAVSAGRCTKGAFMQLVKVSEEMKKDFQFDFVLVVDTEGLRALELAGNATLHHDNELATFVVGLGNMTLINIFGENPADMQDVLQIVVQAFMRMKKVKLSPSCVFVHQNVTDIAATKKNMDGRRRLQEKLDQMAQLAAEEEVCDAGCFSDIIAFDVQKDVKYFAQLWEGSPPMAPPNPGYSESIQELKSFILSKASQSKGMTLSQFKSNIKDLWEALLNENFVFSFKNTLEIAVYRKLEVQYGNWTWSLRSKMLEIENQLHTRIGNGKLNIELNYIPEEMSETYEEIKKGMTTFFDDDRDKEMLVQWRGRFEIKIKEFHDELVRVVERKLNEVIQQKNACKKMDEKKTDFENKMLQKSKELAHQLKDKAKDEKELEKQFNRVWSGWVTELTANIKPIEDIKLEDDWFTILQSLGIEWSFINNSKTSGKYEKISTVGDYSHYVTLKKNQNVVVKTFNAVVNYFKESLSFEEKKQIRSFIEDVEKQTTDIIQSKPVATSGYNSTYLQEVAKNVKEKVREFESERNYALKKEFTVDLLLYVFDKAGRWISESHNKFKMNNDALIYVESKKIQYYNIFRSFCKGNSSAVVLGELICEKLKVSTVEAVCNKTAIHLAGEMRCNFPAFSGNRMDLEKHVLKSLAENEDFGSYINYILRPRNQVERFIRKEVNIYIFTEHKDKALNILKKNVLDINELVSQALSTATENVKTKGGHEKDKTQRGDEKDKTQTGDEKDKTQRGDTEMWLKDFSSSLNDELTFNTICSQNFSDINNFDFLKGEIEKGLASIIKESASLSLDKMKEFRQKPDQILIDQLCNCCWVKCPFCAAVCTNTMEGHKDADHSVPFHRSFAVTGTNYRKSVEACIDFCTTRVAGHTRFYMNDETYLYKDYRKAGPRFANWRISPDGSKLPYWKWFVWRFQKELENHYNIKFQGLGEIPEEWRRFSKEDAIKSLDEICQ